MSARKTAQNRNFKAPSVCITKAIFGLRDSCIWQIPLNGMSSLNFHFPNIRAHLRKLQCTILLILEAKTRKNKEIFYLSKESLLEKY